MSLCHIFDTSCNISNFFIIICYGDLWSVIFDNTIVKRLQIAEGSDDG